MERVNPKRAQGQEHSHEETMAQEGRAGKNFHTPPPFQLKATSSKVQDGTDELSGGGLGPVTPLRDTTTGAVPAVPALSVDRIDIVDSSTGAIGGYPRITSGDLNTPGAFNNPTTGGVNNSHQIHFHLDHGNATSLTPHRELQRSAWLAGTEHKNPVDSATAHGGFDGVIVGPDGPGAHEIQRPSADKIVIADAPGIGALSASQFPFQYRSHFHLKVSDSSGVDIARIKYDVKIDKRSAADVPNTENSITAVEKKDLVRNVDL